MPVSSSRKAMMGTLLALTSYAGSGVTIGGADTRKCANPGCKQRTLSSEFCCLRCAVEAKQKKEAKETK